MPHLQLAHQRPQRGKHEHYAQAEAPQDEERPPGAAPAFPRARAEQQKPLVWGMTTAVGEQVHLQE